MSSVHECQIWPAHPASGRAEGRKDYVEGSARAAVRYVTNPDARARFHDGLEDSCKARLTTMLIDQQERGVEWPEVTSSLIDLAINRPPLPVNERADRLLLFMAKQMKTVAAIVYLEPGVHGALAWSESTEWEEVVYLCTYLIEKGWFDGNVSMGGGFRGRPTVEGHSRIAEQRTNVDSSQTFVAMWFDDSMTAAYADGVELGVRDAGYEPLRIDQKEHINRIDDEIIGEIRRSRFVVADFTHGRDGARGGVYYEAGFAHGLGLPVIFTCQEGSIETLHFDTSHYSHIVWSTPADLREKLRNRILAVIGPAP